MNTTFYISVNIELDTFHITSHTHIVQLSPSIYIHIYIFKLYISIFSLWLLGFTVKFFSYFVTIAVDSVTDRKKAS